MQTVGAGARGITPPDPNLCRHTAPIHTQPVSNLARGSAAPSQASGRICCQAAQLTETASTSGRRDRIRFEDLIETPGLRAPAPNGALQPDEHDAFVRFFRMASPYVEGHRGRIFVLVLPGEVKPLLATSPVPNCLGLRSSCGCVHVFPESSTQPHWHRKMDSPLAGFLETGPFRKLLRGRLSSTW